jgi:hypothetical protein
LLGCMSRFVRPSTTALVFRVVVLGLPILHRYPPTSTYLVSYLILTLDGAREVILANARTRLKFEGCQRPNCPVVVLRPAVALRAAGQETLQGARTHTEYYLKEL